MRELIARHAVHTQCRKHVDITKKLILFIWKTVFFHCLSAKILQIIFLSFMLHILSYFMQKKIYSIKLAESIDFFEKNCAKGP